MSATEKAVRLMGINEIKDSMAIHVLAYAAVKNLKNQKWTRDDVKAWLKGMDEPVHQSVKDKINEILGVKHEQ